MPMLAFMLRSFCQQEKSLDLLWVVQIALRARTRLFAKFIKETVFT